MMRHISTRTVLCLGAAIAHIGSAKILPSSSQSISTDGFVPETEPHPPTPLAVEYDDPLVPEIPNGEPYCYGGPFYHDDFEARNIVVPALAEIQADSEPDNEAPVVGYKGGVKCARNLDNFSADSGFDLDSKARCKRAGFAVNRATGPPLLPVTDSAATDVSKEVTISEIGTLVDDTKADLVPKICKSREFQPTLENYWISGADNFLRDYSRDNQGSSDYHRDGLFKSLAKKYLGDNAHLDCSFGGGTFSTKKCKITCSDVLKNVNSLALGRKVYFSLAAAVGFSEVMGTMHDSFSQIPPRLRSMISLMPEVEFALTTIDGRNLFHSEAQLFLEALQHAVFAAAPWHSVEKVSEKASASQARARSDYDSAVQVYRMIEGGDDPYKWDKLFDPHYEMSISDLDLPRSDAADHVSEDSSMSTEGWHGKTVERAKHVLLDFTTLIRLISAGELGSARESGYSVFEGLFNRIGDAIGSGEVPPAEVPQHVVARLKAGIAETVEEILKGNNVGPDGSTNLSKLLSYGNFLPLGHKQNISKLKSANPVEKLTRNIFMKLFDLSFNGNKVYISCTRDAQRRNYPRRDDPGSPSSCDRDNSGPQHLKACVENYVCYMYRWSERKFDYLSHNKEPKGMSKWGEPPFEISAEDIITSSVLSKIHGIERGESRNSLSDILKTTPGGLSSLGDPRLPGVFHLPICFSRHNWNTQVTGWNTFCDTNSHCPAKNFPCFCGPWGAETESVWHGMGVGQDKKRSNYTHHLCPRQISRKIDDPLERYMAYCSLDIRRNTCATRVNGLIKYSGKDKYCPIFQSIIDLKGYESIDDMDPEVKFALTCKIKKGGKGCSMYEKVFKSLSKAAFDAGYLNSGGEPKKLR